MDGPSKIEIDRDMINNREQKSRLLRFFEISISTQNWDTYWPKN